MKRDQLRLLQGQDLIKTFRPKGGAVKVFCHACGSSLFGGDWPDGQEVAIRFGTLDGDPGIRPQCHTFVGSKAPWHDILDSLPRYEGPLT